MKMTGVILTIGLTAIFGFMLTVLDIYNKLDFSYITKYSQISGLVLTFILIIVIVSVVFYVLKQIFRR